MRFWRLSELIPAQHSSCMQSIHGITHAMRGVTPRARTGQEQFAITQRWLFEWDSTAIWALWAQNAKRHGLPRKFSGVRRRQPNLTEAHFSLIAAVCTPAQLSFTHFELISCVFLRYIAASSPRYVLTRWGSRFRGRSSLAFGAFCVCAARLHLRF